MKLNITKYIFFLILFFIAFLGRTAYHLAPNVEFVTFAFILAGFYLGTKQSLLMITAVMVLSDFILGNTNIFLFTWTGFLIPSFLVSSLLKKLQTTNKQSALIKKISLLTLLGLGSNLLFYIWTNLGVFILDSWGMYSKNFNGLLSCYINALPFLKNQIIGTLTTLPIGVYLSEKFFIHTRSLEKLSQKIFFNYHA
jgi:hypothetical protein